MRLHKIATVAAIAALSAVTASAQDRAERFVQRDGNGDGVLSHDEYTGTGGHPGNFRALDVNGDGVLSRGEFVGRTGAVEGPAAANHGGVWTNDTHRGNEPYVESAAGPEFARMDTNRDSLISRAEWYGSAATFNRMDTNNDRVVTTSEYVAYDTAVNDGRLIKDDRYGDGAYRKDGYGNADLRDDPYGTDSYRRTSAVRRDEDRRFRTLDRNRNGLVERREWTGNTASFRRLDRNRDGRLTRSEFEL